MISAKAFMVVMIGTLFLFSSCVKTTSSSDSDKLGNWVKRSDFEGVARTEAVSFVIGNNVYVGGGYDGTNRLKDFWMYDQQTTTWIRKADMPGVARNSAVAFVVNGKGYVGTGYDGQNKLNDFWEYDPASNQWTQKADFGGTARYGAVAFSLNDKGYISTGYDGNHLKDLWEYNPVTNTWEQRASLGGTKRSDAVAFVYKNKAYVVAGINNGTYPNDFWMYDPETNTWTEKRKISSVSDESYDDNYGNNIVRSNATVFMIDSKFYLSSGDRSAVLGTVWEYNPETDLWSEKNALEGAARSGSIGFTISNRGYIVTGNNSSYQFDDLWEFYPAADKNLND